jgi:hypothetical protein
MLIVEIALGIILACVAMVAAPILFGGILGAAAHVIVALTKQRGRPYPVQGTRQWWITSVLQVVGVFAVLLLIGVAGRLLQ